MDAASSPEVREIVLAFASQTAKTEIINNVLAYHVAVDPCPMLAVFPTDRIATTWSKDRLAPMLRDTAPLRGKMVDRENARKGSGSSEILEKKFPGGLLAITGANSAAGLAMRPVRIVAGDEIDRFPESAGGKGGDEGDPVELVSKRTSNFADSLHVWSSSPGTRGRSRIMAKYERTNRCRWWVECPHCSESSVLGWENVDFGDGGLTAAEVRKLSNEVRAKRARYRCPACERLWDDVERWEAAGAGRWVADDPSIKERVGFTISGLVSPWLTLALLVEEWLEAQGDPLLLQVFVNTRLAELWEEGGERLDPEDLIERVEKYPRRVPNGVLAITMGADVQQAPPRIEVTVWGWGAHGEAWALEHHVLSGDPAKLLDATDDERLDELLLRTDYVREDGAPLKNAASAIDSGGGFYEEVLLYAKKRRRRSVFAIKGRAGETVPLWPLRATKVQRKKVGRAELYVIGVDAGKRALHRMLESVRPPDWKTGDPIPGFVHFPNRPEFDAEYFAQLAGEVKRPFRRKGRLLVEWIQDYPRVEACDCFVYALAALAALSPNWARLAAARKRAATVAQELEPELVDDLVEPEPELEPDELEESKPKREWQRPKRGRGRGRGGFATNY